VVVLVLALGYAMEVRENGFKQSGNENKQEKVEGNVFEYKGRNGVDALTLLKEKTEVGQDKVGMIISIDKIKADSDKREFWAFYVNGKMAEVGAADYKTKDGDIIDWKIENYKFMKKKYFRF
jgi:hypothetical protein